MNLHKLTLVQSADKLNECLNGEASAYEKIIFSALNNADSEEDLRRLEKAYPNFVYVFRLWKDDEVLVKQLALLSEKEVSA